MKPPFETFEHGADIGVRGRGKTRAEAFENGARAMAALMVEDLDTVRPETCAEIACDSYDEGGLFTAWLNAVLARGDMLGLLFRDFQVKFDGLRINGKAFGEAFDPTRHARGVEVKGATFTELSVAEENGTWVAQCVVDV